MTGLIITILIIILIGLIKAKVILILNDGDMALTVKVCGFPIRILPAKEKTVKFDYYSKENIEKRRLAEIKKAKKKAEKKEKKKAAKELKAKKEQEKVEKLKKKGKYKPPAKKDKEKDETALTLIDNINAGASALGRFFYQFGKRLRVDVTRIIITVGTPDAADTAVLYGAISGSVSILIELLQKITNLESVKNAEVDVRCDFLAEKTTADIHIAISLRVWHIFDFLIAAIKAFFRKRKKIRQEKIRLAARKHRAAEIIRAKRLAAEERRRAGKKA